jgi:alpha-glucosidase
MRVVVLVLCCGLSAGTALAAAVRLPGGVRVAATRTGAFTLRVGDRDLLAMAPGAALTLRQFADVVTSSQTAQWSFARTDEQAIRFTRLRGARRGKGRVRLKLVGERSGPGRRARAIVTLTPGTVADTTEVEIAVTPPPGITQTSLALPIRCDPDGTFHGFGEQYGKTDQRGEAFPLWVSEQGIGRDPAKPQFALNGTAHTTYFPMPYYLDARGFGVLVDTARRVDVDLCKSDAGVAWLESVSPEPLRLVVFHGPTPLDVIRQLGARVGRPKAPPAWAYDLWISAQGGRAAVRQKVDALAANDIPAGVIWSQDWTGVRVNFDGGLGVQYRWEADETHYPDLAGFVDELHAEGLRFLVYVNPFVAENLPNHFPAMSAQGLLIKNAAGADYRHLAPNGISSHPALSNPAARDYVKGALRAIVARYDVDGWMADFGEWVPADAVYQDGGDAVAHHNRYPVEWHRLWREVLDEARPDDYVVFARSGFTGVQAVSMVHWVGDQETDWSPTDGLPTVVPAMLNLGLAGVPFVTHDIAGFSGTTAPPTTKELFQRWTELGAFTPIMRTHEGADRMNNWTWSSDAETIAHFRRFARVHAALAPELRALAAEATGTSAPLVRHLMLEFPLLVDGDPIADIELIEDPPKNLLVIMKDGRIHKSALSN